MNTRGFLTSNNIITTRQESLNCFCNICPDMLAYKDYKPSECVKDLWNKYNKNYDCTNTLNGKIFELIIVTVLFNAGIKPFYTNAKVHFVPGVHYDILLYSENNFPVVLSIKTSLRERWKQADLEALALNNVYRKAESYLLTLNEQEADARINRKDEWLGLDDFIYCLSDSFDGFIEKLKSYKFVVPEKIELVEAQSTIL